MTTLLLWIISLWIAASLGYLLCAMLTISKQDKEPPNYINNIPFAPRNGRTNEWERVKQEAKAICDSLKKHEKNSKK